jgi:hypothetical protein
VLETSHRRPFRVAARGAWLGLAVLASGCAAALPGHVPEGGRNKAFERIKPFESGTVADNGRYVPSADERELDCKKLTGSMRVMISRLRDGGRTPTPSAASAVAQSAVAAVRGRHVMLEASVADKRERARLEAYNGLLVEKKCREGVGAREALTPRRLVADWPSRSAAHPCCSPSLSFRDDRCLKTR